MPRQPFYRKCRFCNKPFSTFEEDKLYCNRECEVRGEITENLIPKEENPDYEEFGRARGYRQCYHCGKEHRVDSSHPYYGRAYFYCDGKCMVAREIYNKRSREFTCKECGSKFKANGRSTTYCSEACRRGNRKTKRVSDYTEAKKNSPKTNRKKGKPVPYGELNRRAEVKRLENDWKRLVK